MNRTAQLLVAALSLLAAATFAACGDSSDDSGNAQNTRQSTNAAQSIPPGNVTVTEDEWVVRTVPGSVTSGPVRFNVANKGDREHELVILRTSKPAADLGQGREAAEPGNVGEIQEIKATEAASKTLRLRPGHYALICNLPGHYKAGMHTDLQVR